MVAWVTGASSGIGEGIARMLSAGCAGSAQEVEEVVGIVRLLLMQRSNAQRGTEIAVQTLRDAFSHD
jgi:NAD(P)-dependent dehydrogenase (short-subunit alcohol dehydrogenase family)